MQIQIFIMLGLVYHVIHLRAETYYVCKGSAVKLLSNTTLKTGEGCVSLFRDDRMINQWSANINDAEDDKIKEAESKKRIVRDGNDDIWLHDFRESDSGLYKVVYLWEVNSHTSREEKMDGNLKLCTPPDSNCKPRIQRIREDGKITSLNATLEAHGCGIPPVTSYWLGSDSNNSILDIEFTDGPRAYIACIRGPSMRCLRDDMPHTYFCVKEIINTFDDMATTKPQSDEADTIRRTFVLIVYLTIGASIFVVTRLIYFLAIIVRRLYKENREHRSQSSLNEKSLEQFECSVTEQLPKAFIQQESQSTQNGISSEPNDYLLIKPKQKKHRSRKDRALRNRRTNCFCT